MLRLEAAMAKKNSPRGALEGPARYTKEACARRLLLLRLAVANLEGRKITQTEFAERAGLKQSGYTHYENGLRLPSIDAAAALADTYDLSLDWLYLGQEFNMPFEIMQEIKRVDAAN